MQQADLDNSLVVGAGGRPRLLVSVRSAEEALAALEGGCDILDIKEPRRGSLGMADAAVIESIFRDVRRVAPGCVISAACGEVHEFESSADWVLPSTLGFVKLGCARLGQVGWRSRWQRVRNEISSKLGDQTGWVAVAYADWQQAESPWPADIVAAAIEANCRGVLVDTCVKDGRGLFDWGEPANLRRFAEALHEAGVFLALAGSLRLRDIPNLAAIGADVVAIRGAACAGENRTAEISAAAVREFQVRLRRSGFPV